VQRCETNTRLDFGGNSDHDPDPGIFRGFFITLAIEGIVALGVTLSRRVCVRRADYHVSTARLISLAKAKYPVLSIVCYFITARCT